ncbi:hypothetical protein ACFC0M_00555 [Streptomyces sp. NPDC056149]|uniref:hypothetical protein n=1 Tax=Streptomyces sp. NPDC056149 TaxID=3345728 RepID=UPI0035DB65D4
MAELTAAVVIMGVARADASSRLGSRGAAGRHRGRRIDFPPGSGEGTVPIGRPVDNARADTGGIGRWAPYGELRFLGCADDQVKIRGMRIDLGEIEALLREFPGITECAVVVDRPARPSRCSGLRWPGRKGVCPEGARPRGCRCTRCPRSTTAPTGCPRRPANSPRTQGFLRVAQLQSGPHLTRTITHA